MPRTALAVQEIQAGKAAQLAGPAADQANGNSFVNDGHTRLVVKNGDASSRTITVVSKACSHGRTGDVSQPVAAGEVAVLGPFDPATFNQTDGTVNVDWSASTPGTVKCTPVRTTPA